jgi:plastocyanin
MRKGIWSATAFVVLMSGAGAFLTVSGALAADNNKVTMKDQLMFDPDNITVQVNTPVVFHNGGNIQHDAKAEDNSFTVPLLDPGKEHTITPTKVGDIKYYCTVEGHKAAGMVGTIHVTAASSTPAPPASPTPGPGETSTTATTAVGATTTTTRAGATGAGQSTTTTTAPAAGGATSTTQAPSVTPTSAPETGGVTPATGAGDATEQAGEEHATKNASEKKQKNSPIGIAFAAVSTLLLAAIAGKLLASKP